MSLSDNKRKVFTTIGAYTSYMKQTKPPKGTDTYPSVNNKKDPIPYLLDILKTVAGSESLKELTGGLLTKLIDDSEIKLKTALKKQFTQSNSGENLGSNFDTNTGINIKVKDIDIKGKFKESPTSDTGNLLYEKAANFDKIAHDAIVNTNVDQDFAGMNMKIKYIENIDSFNIKPAIDVKIGDYFINYIEKTQIINKNELVSNVMDMIFGTLSKKTNKTPEQVLNDLSVQKILNQVLNDDDSFEISPSNNDELLKNAVEISNGIVNYDMCCGDMPSTLPFSSLEKLIKTISGSTDPFIVGNAVEATIVESTSGNTVVSDKNKETIKDGFFQKLINIFTVQMLQAATTAPQIRTLMAIMSALQNNGISSIGIPKDDMKNFKILIKCMAKEIKKMIAEFIFNLVVSYLIKLLTPIIKKIIKEKINQYSDILKSLTPASKLVNST